MSGQMTRDFQQMAQKFAHFVDHDLPAIMEVEGLKHFKKSFEDEGFTDTSLKKWDKRKTTDIKGRDLTRRKDGSLSKFGERNLNRPVLTGFATGSNKLRNSLRAKRIKAGVVFFTHKEYAKRHNEGIDEMPKRQFMGDSQQLTHKIKIKTGIVLNKIFKK